MIILYQQNPPYYFQSYDVFIKKLAHATLFTSHTIIVVKGGERYGNGRTSFINIAIGIV